MPLVDGNETEPRPHSPGLIAPEVTWSNTIRARRQSLEYVISFMKLIAHRILALGRMFSEH